MSNIGFYLNHQQLIDVGTKLNCKYDDIGKVIKTSLIGEERSRYFRDFFAKTEVKKEEVNENAIIDAYLESTEPAIIMDRRSDLTTRPKFTPKQREYP